MKIGDYVRTEKGTITKYNAHDIILNEFENRYYYTYDTCCEDSVSELVIKSSPNIIDLIEVGDYVNDMKIVSIGQLTNGPEEGTKTIDYYIAPNSLYYFKNEDIKSILTKEQFESMEYKVGEDNEK